MSAEAPSFENLINQYFKLENDIVVKFGISDISGEVKVYSILSSGKEIRTLDTNLVSVGINGNNVRLSYTNEFNHEDRVDYSFISHGVIEVTETRETSKETTTKKNPYILKDLSEAEKIFKILAEVDKLKTEQEPQAVDRIKAECLNLIKEISSFTDNYETRIELVKINRSVGYLDGRASWKMIYEGLKNEDIYEFLDNGELQMTRIRSEFQDPLTGLIRGNVEIIPVTRSVDFIHLHQDLIKTQEALKMP